MFWWELFEDIHLKIRLAAEGRAKGKQCWERRVGLGRYCANVHQEVSLTPSVAELVKCCSSATAEILQCLCIDETANRALLQPEATKLKCFKQTVSHGICLAVIKHIARFFQSLLIIVGAFPQAAALPFGFSDLVILSYQLPCRAYLAQFWRIAQWLGSAHLSWQKSFLSARFYCSRDTFSEIASHLEWYLKSQCHHVNNTVRMMRWSFLLRSCTTLHCMSSYLTMPSTSWRHTVIALWDIILFCSESLCIEHIEQLPLNHQKKPDFLLWSHINRCPIRVLTCYCVSSIAISFFILFMAKSTKPPFFWQPWLRVMGLSLYSRSRPADLGSH